MLTESCLFQSISVFFYKIIFGLYSYEFKQVSSDNVGAVTFDTFIIQLTNQAGVKLIAFAKEQCQMTSHSYPTYYYKCKGNTTVTVTVTVAVIVRLTPAICIPGYMKYALAIMVSLADGRI